MCSQESCSLLRLRVVADADPTAIGSLVAGKIGQAVSIYHARWHGSLSTSYWRSVTVGISDARFRQGHRDCGWLKSTAAQCDGQCDLRPPAHGVGSKFLVHYRCRSKKQTPP